MYFGKRSKNWQPEKSGLIGTNYQFDVRIWQDTSALDILSFHLDGLLLIQET